MNITQTEYNAFQRAYDFFNAQLFNSNLPDVLITLQRHNKAHGFLAREKFVGRGKEATAHELALNPDHFGRTDEAILSTLVHEMVHVWQVTHGTPPRKSYHDRQWSAKMKEIGLQPSNTGAPGGKETGAKMSHYVIEAGRFALALADLTSKGFALNWQSQTETKDREKKAESKTKYTCPECEQNAWAKPGAVLICGVCFDETGKVHYMESN